MHEEITCAECGIVIGYSVEDINYITIFCPDCKVDEEEGLFKPEV